MRFVVVTGGDFTPTARAQEAIKQADRIIAADSGADTALQLGIYPSVVVGDLDSIGLEVKKKLLKHGTQFVDMPTTLLSLPKGSTMPLDPSEKDQTDTELAINFAVQHGATEITIFGGIVGDRFDHIIANVLLSTAYSILIRFIAGNQMLWVSTGPSKQTIHGKKGDLLSLIPLSQKVVGITTDSLYYPLKNNTLMFGKPRGI